MIETPAGWFLQAISVMEVPVVKIREGEAGAEDKTMIKSIVNMVKYCSSVSVHWESNEDGLSSSLGVDLISECLIIITVFYVDV